MLIRTMKKIKESDKIEYLWGRGEAELTRAHREDLSGLSCSKSREEASHAALGHPSRGITITEALRQIKASCVKKQGEKGGRNNGRWHQRCGQRPGMEGSVGSSEFGSYSMARGKTPEVLGRVRHCTIYTRKRSCPWLLKTSHAGSFPFFPHLQKSPRP